MEKLSKALVSTAIGLFMTAAGLLPDAKLLIVLGIACLIWALFFWTLAKRKTDTPINEPSPTIGVKMDGDGSVLDGAEIENQGIGIQITGSYQTIKNVRITSDGAGVKIGGRTD